MEAVSHQLVLFKCPSEGSRLHVGKHVPRICDMVVRGRFTGQSCEAARVFSGVVTETKNHRPNL